MGFFGTILFLATTGVSIYYFPTLFFGISWSELVAIRNPETVKDFLTVIKNYGWSLENASSEANRIFIISIVICAIVGLIVIASILYSHRRVGK